MKTNNGRPVLLKRTYPLIGVLFLLLTSCEQKSSLLVEPRGTTPVLLSATITPRSINTDTINVGPVRNPTDVLTISLHIAGVVHADGPVRVRYSLRFVGDFDDLGFGEYSVADSSFTFTANISFLRSAVGTVMASVVALNPEGDESSQFLFPVSVTRLNRPPVLSALSAPDTVSPSHIQSFLITVRVSDPDGAADIRDVFRTGTTGNIFHLNDAGLNGDQTAYDGVYTETVSLNPAPPVGSYTFTFRAVDRSSDTSNVLSKTVVVIP